MVDAINMTGSFLHHARLHGSFDCGVVNLLLRHAGIV
jgi:hypothetical protein